MADNDLVQTALGRGYSLDEIANKLSADAGMDPKEIRARGYDSGEIIGKFGYQVPAEKPGMLDSAISTGKGIIGGISDAAKSVYAGATAPDEATGSVLDRTPAVASTPDTQGADISMGAGPVRADWAAKTASDVAKMPVPDQAKLAQGDGATAAVARQVLPKSVDQAQRVASGDLMPIGQDEAFDDAATNRPALPHDTTALDIAKAEFNGVLQAGDEAGVFMGMVGSEAGHLLFDKAYQVVTQSPDAPVQDYIFKNVVAPFDADSAKRGLPQNAPFSMKMANTVGGLGVMILESYLTGGAEFAPAMATSIKNILANAGRRAFSSMALPASIGMESTMQKVLDTTGDQAQAAKAGAAQFLATVAMGMGNTEGRLSNSIMFPAMSAGTHPFAQAPLPESMRTPMTWEDHAMNAVLGFGMGHGKDALIPDVRSNSRIIAGELSDHINSIPDISPQYEAGTPGATPQINWSTPGKPRLVTRDTTTPPPEIMAAGNVDEAIAAAQSHLATSTDANLTTIRPLSQPKPSQTIEQMSADVQERKNAAQEIANAQTNTPPSKEVQQERPVVEGESIPVSKIAKDQSAPIPNDANALEPTAEELAGAPRMLDPHEAAQQQFTDRAKVAGLTDSQINDLLPTEPRDHVTGFFRAEQKAPVVARAQKYTADTGIPTYFVDADIANLGGINALFKDNHTQANAVYRNLSDIFHDEISKAGGQVISIRHGGDEISAVVVGASDASIEAAKQRITQRVQDYSEQNGMQDLPHTKEGKAPGIGLHLGYTKIHPEEHLDNIFERASAGVNESKTGGNHVGGIETGEASGALRDARPEGIASEDRSGEEGIRGSASRVGQKVGATPGRVEGAESSVAHPEVPQDNATAKGGVSVSAPAEVAKDIAQSITPVGTFEKTPGGMINVKGYTKEVMRGAADALKIKGVIIGKNGNAIFPKGTNLDALKDALGVPLDAVKEIKTRKAITHDTTTLFGAIKAMGGIKNTYAQDITGETNPRNMKGYPPGIFTKNGHSLDEVARQLSEQYGFHINLDDLRDNGGINQATELLHQAASGSPVYSMARMDVEQSKEAELKHKSEVFRLADEYGVESKIGTKARPFDEVTRAKEALDQAGVTGTDRTSTIAAVRRGDLTADEVAESHGVQDEAKPAIDMADRIHTLAVHDDVMNRVRSGDMTADEFKASFDSLLKNKDGIIAEISAMTKPEIFKEFPGLVYRYKNENKASVVDAAYREMIGQFALRDSITYGMGKNSYENAVRTKVEGTDDAKLAEVAASVKAAKLEHEARNNEAAAGMENPQTLDDYKRILSAKAQEIGEGATFKQARMAMTPEQRAKFDELAAEQTRIEREDRKSAQQEQSIRAPGEAVETTPIIQTKHTKHGHDLWQFNLVQRVSGDEFKSLVVQAKKLGGDYSSYRGNGAIPGWQFRTEEAAKAFKSLVAGDASEAKGIAKARRDSFADDRSQSATERLTEMAGKLDEQADASLNQERKSNTDRRARQAASAESSARNDKAMAETMRNIANAIKDGSAKFLDKIRQKVQVEALRSFANSANQEMLREKYPDYGEREKHKDDPITAEAADYLTYPSYTAYRSDLASLGRSLLETEGTKKLGQRIMKVADDVTDTYLKFAKDNIDKVSTFSMAGGKRAAFASKADAETAIERSGYRGTAIVLPVKRGENQIVLSPSEAMKRGIWQGDNDKRITLSPDFGEELVEKMGKAARRGAKVDVPWQFENAYDSRKRLAGMGLETPAELRAALREYIGLREAPKEADKIKEMERAMIGRKNDGLDFFPTPAHVADEMIETAGIKPGMSVLEPSAGMGHIADRIREAGVDPDVVELSGDRRNLLEAKGYNLVGDDFMNIKPREFYTYGDTFKTPEGMEGIMRGSGGLGSNRVGLEDAEGNRQWVDRDSLEPVRKNGSDSGYDRILMNPPFGDRRDALHVQHAYELLKPGGRLVAIMGEGSFFGGDKKAQAFRDWIDEHGGTSEKLDAGTFNDPSLPVNTGVNARMVVIDKPAKGESLYSRSSEPLTNPHTTDTLRASLGEAFSPKFVDALEKTGKFRFGTNEDAEAAGNTVTQTGENGRPLAFYKDGVTTIIPENIPKTFTKDQAKGLLAHEIGEHALQLGQTDKEYQAILRDLELRVKAGNKDAVAARQRAIDAGTPEADLPRETMGYLVESAPTSSIAQRFMTWFKSAVNKVLGPARMRWAYTPEDMATMAQSALRKAPDMLGKQEATGDQAILNSNARRDWYRSQLSEAVSSVPAKVDNTSGNNWDMWLQSNAAKLGVKKEEIQWSGITDYLKLRGKEKVSAADVQDFLANNGVKVRDVVLSDQGYKLDENGKRIDDGAGGFVENGTPTKFKNYTVPGGSNYREMLITLPSMLSAKEALMRPLSDATAAWRDAVEEFGPGKGTEPALRAERMRIAKEFDEASAATRDEFRSSHFDQLNILAHLRFDDRTDADGKRVLFIHEIQSDWGQSARKNGLKLTEAERIQANTPANTAAEYNAQQELIHRGAVGAPNGPFVGDTKAWVALALKRAIAYAAEHGYDKVAIINGEQAAGLYDLSKQVREIDAEPNNDGTYDLTLTMPDGMTQKMRNIEEKALEDNVGKDLAKKIITDSAKWIEANKAYRSALKETGVSEDRLDELRAAREAIDLSYTGLDLKVGGEGMKAFYDSIVPNVANDVLKRIGGGKVEEVSMSGSKSRDELAASVYGKGETYKNLPSELKRKIDSMFDDRGLQQSGFDITPTMREQAAKGLPLFSRAKDEAADADGNYSDMSQIRQSAISKAIDRAIAMQQGENVPPVKRESARLALAKLRGQLDSGKIHDAQFIDAVEALHNRMEDAAAAKKMEVKARMRGATWIAAKLATGVHEGTISQGAADMASWFIKQNPALVEGLAISIRQAKENEQGARGQYTPYNRLATLFSGKAADTTGVHEVLHHLERLMPADMQDRIRQEYFKQIQSERENLTSRIATSADARAQLRFLDDVVEFGISGKSNVADRMKDAIKNGDVPASMYRFVNPSEFWAVGMTDRMAERFHASDSVFGRTVQWVREAVQHIKGALGLSSDAPMLRAMNELLNNGNGKLQSKDMLGVGENYHDPIDSTKAEEGDIEERKPSVIPGATAIEHAKGFASDILDRINSSDAMRDVKLSTIPMSEGSPEAKSSAQKFANDLRVAQFQWHKMDTYLRLKFNKEQREAMWNAADEQNTLMQQGADTKGKGIDTLPPDQRATMQTLHTYANELWQRATDAGMVTGEGMPFWTPRMAVMIGEDGAFERPGGDGKRASSKGEGGNITTSASSLKHRKYLTAEETEAAMKGAIGDGAEIVRDIRTMPMAMARLETAIAGRELVNQIKSLGQVAGKDLISESMQPNFITIDHPAFTRFEPKENWVKVSERELLDKNYMVRDGEVMRPDPKEVAGYIPVKGYRVAEDGGIERKDVVFEKQPLFISKEWEGPLKAVMSTKDGAVYRAYMLIKSKAMTAIMSSPLTHNMVIAGRAMAYDPVAVMSLKAYFVGNALAKDNALMSRAIKAGMVPMGANKNSMMDITDIARGIGKQGGWGDPNESWINLGVQKLGNALKAGVGDTIKNGGQVYDPLFKKTRTIGMDAFGDWYHHDLLWKQVGALQTYIFNDYSNYLVSKGHPQAAADAIAAHLANRYGGSVARENQSEMARKALNVMLFSRSFNVGNVGAVKDTAFGLPAGLEAKMYADVGKEAGDKAMAAAKGKARMSLAADLGMAMLLTSVTSSAISYLVLNQTPDEIKDGYIRRLNAMLGNIKDHPLDPTSYDPYQVLPTWDNEEGKQERIDIGADASGRHEYMRLPTGKVVEDTVGWLLHAPDTFAKKLSPMAKSGWQAVTNDKGYGVPVEDPDGSTLKHIAQGLEHVIKAQVPWDTMKTLYDVVSGHGTDLDKHKLAGFATGFSTSQGNPHGPAASEVYAVEDRMKAAKAFAMEAVKRDLKYGYEDAARSRLEAIGFSAREITKIINGIESPKQGMSKQSMKKFNLHSTEEERAKFDSLR